MNETRTPHRLRRISVALLVILESVLVTTALGVVLPAAKVANALPQVPNAPVTVYLQDFETPEVAGTTVPAGVLTAFPSMSASGYWTNVNACNGIWISFSAPVPPSGIGTCTPGPSSGYDGIRGLAQLLGGNNNHAISSYTHNGIASPTGQLQLATPNITVTPGHYYVASVRVASDNCFSNPAVQRFVLTDGVTTSNLGTSTACPGPIPPNRQVATLIAPNPVRWTTSTLKMQLFNDTAAGNGSGDDSAIDDFKLLDVTPALDKSFSPSTVIPGQPSTLTFTITNSSDLLPKPDWSFIDTLPAGVVVAPTPNIGGTCVNTTGTVLAVTADANTTVISVVGGDLVKDQQFCTITVDVVATPAVAATYTNGAGASTVTTNGLYPPPPATLTVIPAVVRIAKTSVGAVGSFGYTLTGATPTTDSITTATSGVKVTSPTVHAASYSDVVVTESSGMAGFSTSSTCVDANAATTGNAPINGTGTSVTIPRANVLPGSNWTCSFTNIRLPVVRVAKVSNGGTGTFNFTLGGLSNATDSVVTATAGTTVASAQTNTGTVGTSATVTETAASATGYVTRYSCVDSGPTANAAITGTGTAAVIPGANMQAGANWLCTYTNDKVATLRIVKSVPAGQGTSFDFTQTGVPATAIGAPNAASAGSFTLNPSVLVSGSLTDTQTYTNVAPGSVISFSEIARANISQYALVSMTCTNAAGAPVGSTFVIGAINNGAAIGSPLGTSTVTLAPGADVTCTFSNVRNPRIVLNKTTQGGDGTFAFTETVTGSGVAVSNPSPSLTTSAGTATTNTTITGLAGAATTTLTITESANAAYNLTDVTCVNLTTSQTLTTLTTPSSTVNLVSRQVVVTPIGTGAQISCTFTNAKKPTMVIAKQSVGGTGSFSFGAGTNGLPTGPLAISTATSNPSSSSPFTLNAANTSTSITEAIPAGWQLTGVQCVDASSTVLAATIDLVAGALTLPAASVAAGANITCTFTNAKLGSITIVKDAVPNDAQDFSFTSSGAGTSNFVLDDDADATRSNSQLFSGLSAGSYPVVEAAAAGWSLTSLTCAGDTDTGSVVTLGSRQVAIDLDPGENITCTFVNTKAAALDTTKVVTTVNGAPATAATQVKAGDVIVYTIVTANTGGAAASTTLTDVVPANTTYTGSGEGWSCTAPAAAGTSCTQTFSVPGTSTVTRTFTLTVGTLPAGTQTVGNVVASSGGSCSSCNPSNPTVPALNTTKVVSTVNGAAATPTTQVKAGDVIVYSIVTTNTGGTAGTTTLTDVVPTNTTYTGSGEGWSCAAPAAAGTSCTQNVNVAANSSVTRTFTLTVGTLPVGTLTVGNVVASSGGTCTSCNPNNPTVPVLNTTKVVSTVNGAAATAATQVKAGDVVVYSIVTTNTGGSVGTTTLTDVVPTNTTYTGSGEGWSCTAPAAAGTSCTQVVIVGANSSVTRTFTLTVGTLPAGTQTVANLVASTGGTCASCNPSNPTNPVLNTTKVVSTVNGAAATAATQVKAGDVIVYSIVTTNTGGSVGTTTLTDVVPTNTTYTGSGEGWSCTAPAAAGTSCTQLVSVPANSSVTRTFTLTVGTLPAGTLTVGNVVASTGGTCTSCNPNNPTVPALNTTKVVTTVNGAAANSGTVVGSGDVVVYTIVTSNTGGSAGTTTLTDVVPTNTTYTGSGEGWSCAAPAPAGTSCTQNINVAANSSVTRTFTLTVGTLPSGTQTVGNVVASSGGTCSSCNPSNPTAPGLNTTKVVTSVNGAAATATTQVKAGDVIVYTIVTTNTGGAAGTTTLTDVVPVNTTYTGSGQGWSCTAPAAAGTSCTQTISVPANSSLTRTFTLTVGTLPAGTLTVGNLVASSAGTCSSCNPSNPTVPALNTTKVATTVNGAGATPTTQVKAGDVIVYSIVTANTGGSVGSTTLTDIVPTNTSYTGSGEGWSCAAPAAAGTSCTQLVSVPANGSVTRTFTLTVGALPAGTQTVGNVVASSGGTCSSCNPSNPTTPTLNTTKVVTSVNGAAATPATQVKPGDVIVYTIVTTNTGGSVGTTTLTDVVPTNTSYTGSGEGWSCTAPAAAGTSCTQTISVPANGSTTNTFTLTVGTLPAGTQTVGNVVASSGGTCSSCNPSNPTTPTLNTTKVVTTVNGAAATPATQVKAGDVIVYSIVTTNTGGSAGSTTLTDVVPVNTTYTGSGEGWSCTNPTAAGASCTQNISVAANSSVTRTFTLTVGTLPAGTQTVGNVVASSGGTCSSCNPSNPTTPTLNTTKVVTSVNGAPATPATQVKAGDVIVYTIVTTNTGGSAGSTTLTDVVPTNTSYTGSGEGWSCLAPAPAGTSCAQTIAVPANGSITATFTLTVGVLPAGTQTVGNVVASSGGTCSSCNPSNPTTPTLNTTKVVTSVNGAPATPATQVKAGDVIVYTIVTTNTGGSTGTTTLTDVVPTNTTYTGSGEGWSCTNPTAAGASCTQTISVLANSSVTRTFTLTVGTLPAGTLTVGNVVASSGGTCSSCNPSNPTTPTLNTTKVVSSVNGAAATPATQVKAGDVVVYTIVTANTGGSTGTTTLTDVVPTNTTYTGSGEGWSCTAPAAAGTSCTQTISVPANSSVTRTFTLTVATLPAGTQTVANLAASSGGTCSSCNPSNPTTPTLNTTKVVTSVNGAPATPATQVKAGDVIVYTIVTTNTGGSSGTTTLTDVVPTNTTYTGSGEGWSCTNPTAAGTSCTQTISVPANSSITNTFTLTVGTLPVGTLTVGNVVASSGGTCSSCNPSNPTVPVLDTTKIVTTVNGAAATSATPVKAGDVVVYTIVTTNTGGSAASTTLTDVVPVNTTYTGSGEGWSCTNPTVAGTSCTQTISVAANSSVTRTFTLTVGTLPVGTLTVGNVVASSGGTCSSCNPTNPTVAKLDTTKVVTSVNGQPATTSTPVFAGDVVVYTIVTTNIGGVAATTTLTDVVPTNTTYTGTGEGWSCTNPTPAGTSCTQTITVPANSSLTRTFTLTVGAIPPGTMTVSNVVTSSGGTCSSCTPTNPVARPSISIDKTADLVTYTAVNDVIHYSFVITNTGNVPLSAITVADVLPGLSPIVCAPVANGSIALAIGQSTTDIGVTCSASYTIGQADLDAGHVTNSATATGTPPRGPDVTATDGVTVPATTSTGITLQKTVYLGHDSGAGAPGSELVTGIAGTPITYVFTITNTSTVTLFGVSLADPLLGISSTAGVVLLSGDPAVLLPGESVTFYVETAMTTDLLNTATAGADVPGGDLTDPSDDITTTDTASVDVVNPSISLVKVARGTTDGAVHTAAYGTPVTFDFTITNTGDTALGSIQLVDNTCSPISLDPDPNGNGRLDIGEIWTGTCTLAAVFTDFVNVADASGNPVSGSGADLPGVPDVVDSDDAAVDVLGNVAVDKSDPTITFDSATGQYTAVYTVVVTNAGADTTYALDDALHFGGDLSVVSASITVDQAGITPLATWNGLSDPTVVASAPIAHAATHTYTVTVVATVDPSTSTSSVNDCILTVGEQGTGFLNEASASADGSTSIDTGCGSVPDPSLTITKTVTAGPIDNVDGTSSLTYRILVTNTADGPGRYDLDDQLRFGSGITVVSVGVANISPGSIATNGGFDGVGDTRVATAVAIAGRATHTYDVTVRANTWGLTSTTAADCTLGTGETGTGFRNDTTLTTSAGSQTANACEPAPLPGIVVTKTVSGAPVLQLDGRILVGYDIDVVNNGAGWGTYTLDDATHFPTGVTVDSATVTNTVPGGLSADPLPSIVTTPRPLAPGELHRYHVDVLTTVAPSVPDPVRDCGTGTPPNLGFMNEATVHVLAGDATSAACAPIPKAIVSITKTVVGPATVDATGAFTRTYEIRVANTGDGAGVYDLSDTLMFGDGITITTASMTDPAGATVAAWNGTTLTAVVSGDPIAAQSQEIYTVTVTGSIAGATSIEATDCQLDITETGTGFLNTAALTFSNTTITAIACEPEPDPDIHVDKSAATPVHGTDGRDTITYMITATNTGGAGTYDLTDTLSFGGAITIISATATTVSGPTPASTSWNGVDDTTVATSVFIPAGGIHSYRVIVIVDPLLVAPGEGACTGGPGASGYLNSASLDYDGATVDDSACQPVADPNLSVAKTVAGTVLNADGTTTVTYHVIVTNSGDGPGRYTLTDRLRFGTGIVVAGAAASATSTAIGDEPVVSPTWNGVDDLTLATDQPIRGHAIHTYTVVVTANTEDIASTTSADCTLDTDETGTGLRNDATLTSPAGTETVDACVPPPTPSLTVTKTVTSGPTRNDDGTYEITYGVVVTNTTAGTGHYDLVDAPQFGAGITVTGATVTAADAATPAPNASWDGVDDTNVVDDALIAGLATHRYTVTITATVAPTINADAADCTDVAGDGTGFLNTAQLSSPWGSGPASACVPAPLSDLRVTKEAGALVAGSSVGRYTLDYTITVANVGDGDGAYTLTDTFSFGAGVTVLDVSVANTAPGDVTVNPDFDGATDVTVASEVAIDPGAMHSYTVTVAVDTTAIVAEHLFDCINDNGETGTGLLNSTTATPAIDRAVGAVVAAATPTGRDGRPTRVEAFGDPATATACVEVPELIDLSLAKTASSTAATVGSTVHYAIALNNAGPHTATGVSIVDTLPAGLTLIGSSLTSTGGGTVTASGSAITWTVPSITAGQTITLSYDATVNTVGSLTNTVEVMTADQTDVDSTPGNGGTSEDDIARATVGAVAVEPPVTTTTPPPVVVKGPLPFTGADVATLLAFGVALLGGGAFVMLITRRRRSGRGTPSASS